MRVGGVRSGMSKNATIDDQNVSGSATDQRHKAS
jgi:hypothetical protein